jgi:hypothetical protein
MISLRKQSKAILHALTVELLLFIAAGTLKAQTVTWTQVGFATAPAARENGGIAYDEATHSTVLFGGYGNSVVYGDTWTWDRAWRLMLPVNSPSPRQGPAMAFDGATGTVVLFGGSSVPFVAGSAFGDTWIWNGRDWTQQFPPVSPSPRLWSQMIYNPVTKTVLLFGGTNTPNGDNGFGDTWAWDGVSKTWTELHPFSHPSGRATNQLAYDRVTGTVVLFGGVTTNLTPLNDTWTWNGTNWRHHFPASSPAPRNGPAMVYDSRLRAVVLFGGAVGTCCSNSLNDTWTWNGLNWTQIYPANTLPSARNAPAMDYDTLRKVILMFGGADNSGRELDDTWFLSVAP